MLKKFTDEEIGQLIRDKRKALNLTQTQLGEKLGVGAAAVNKWEQGKVTNIKRTILHGLSDILKIHPAQLIGFGYDNKHLYISRLDFTDEEYADIENFVRFIKFKRGEKA